MDYDHKLPPASRPDPDGRMPGMSSDEIALAKTYLRDNPDLYQRVYWNVRVGRGVIDDVMHLPEPYMSQAVMNSQLRIDMIGVPHNDIEWDLIEYRINAGVGIIGSLLSYHFLWPLKWHPCLKLIGITNTIRPDILAVAECYKITMIAVEPGI